jgi:hypothetical protein
VRFGHRRRQQQSEREVPKEQEKEEKEVNGGAVEDFRNLVKSGQDVRASLMTTIQFSCVL